MVKQKQADMFNELQRAEGHIGNLARASRRGYLSKNRDQLRKQLGRLAVKLDT